MMKVSSKELTIIFISLLFLAFLVSFGTANIWTASIVLLYVVMILFCLRDLNTNAVYLMFLVCFFVFLVGGLITYECFGMKMAYSFDEDYYNYMTSSIFLSVLFVSSGYIISSKVKRRSNGIENENSIMDDQKRIVQKIALYSQYILMVPYAAVLFETIMVVSSFGYSEYYVYESRLPQIIIELSDLYIYVLFLYLGTLPEKKEARIPLIIFVVFNCISVLTGRRMYFVVDNMVLLCYLFFRNKLDKTTIWIKKKHIVIIVITIPFLVVFLYVYHYTRYGWAYNESTPIEMFLSFFQQQGFSANLIPLGKMYSAEIGNDIYSIYDIIKVIRRNPLGRIIWGSTYASYYSGSREYMALFSGSFARAISYAVVRTRYLAGYGMGSCYIAELYHDFGYVGICFGNLLYGHIMARIKRLSNNSVIKNTIVLLMIRGFFKSPRFCYDSPFFEVLSWTLWVYVGCVFILSNILSKRQKKSKEDN